MLPRERYLLTGPEGAGAADLVALVLGTGAGGRSSRVIAEDLLERFGGLAGLAAANPASIAAVRGVGPARAIRLHAGLVAGQRARVDARATVGPVRDATDAMHWFAPALDGLGHEELHALYLDRRSRPLAYRRLSSGNDGFTIVDARQVLKPAVELNAHGVILAHNHPSGDPEPSREDLHATRTVASAARVLGLKLLDHIVVGGTAFVSIAARGEIPEA